MKSHTTTRRRERLRTLAAAMSAVLLVAACGGGGGSSNTPPGPPPPPPPPPPPSAKFAAPVGAAASSVQVSADGSSARFVGTAAAGAKSDVAVTLDAGSFYYVEATRSQLAGVALGISASAATEPPSGGFVPRADTLLVSGEDLVTADAAGTAVTLTGAAGSGSVFGFAVDLRSDYPAISVIAPASVNPDACAPITGNAPCVVYRWRSAVSVTTLSIYAQGTGDGSTGPSVSINTGSNQLAQPYTYATGAVLAALRASRLQGAVGFNPQWPTPTGPGSLPTLALTPGGGDRAVVRRDDVAPFQTLVLTPTNAAGGTIAWVDENGVSRGSGASLTLDTALMAALGDGEHVLTASVVNPQNGRYGEKRVRLLVALAGDNSDHDGDGLSYSAERALGLNPGNADTDGDGLSDGAEAALGKNPLVADNTDAPTGVPLRAALAREVATNPGLIVGDDGLTVTFTDELNPGCDQKVAPFDDPVYSGSRFGSNERCFKRAVRADVAVQPGEFRYFETHRLNAGYAGALSDPPNLGQGIVTATAQIDPYCCFFNGGDPNQQDPNIDTGQDFDYTTYVEDPPGVPKPGNPTPPSMAVNSVGGNASMRLVSATTNFNPGFDPSRTVYYGFAVDYTGADPKVYVVVTDSADGMAVSDAVAVPNFGGGPAVPMLYGHPLSDTLPFASINLGLQQFHYDLGAIKTAVQARCNALPGPDQPQCLASLAQLKPGVGAHRWYVAP